MIWTRSLIKRQKWGGLFSAQLSGIILFGIDSYNRDLSYSKSITKYLSESHHPGLAIWPWEGGGFSATWSKVAGNVRKWLVPVWPLTEGGLFCPTFRYHQFDHGFQWCMKCVQSCMKKCLKKFTLHDLTNVETFLGVGAFLANLNQLEV